MKKPTSPRRQQVEEGVVDEAEGVVGVVEEADRLRQQNHSYLFLHLLILYWYQMRRRRKRTLNVTVSLTHQTQIPV